MRKIRLKLRLNVPNGADLVVTTENFPAESLIPISHFHLLPMHRIAIINSARARALAASAKVCSRFSLLLFKMHPLNSFRCYTNFFRAQNPSSLAHMPPQSQVRAF